VGQETTLEVLGPDGETLVELVDTVATRGAHRVIWDLRHPPRRGLDGRPLGRLRGRFVLPGRYGLRLTVGDQVHTRSVEVRMDPALALDEGARRALDRTLDLQSALAGAAAVAEGVVSSVVTQSRTARDSLQGMDTAPEHLRATAQTLLDEALRLQVTLEGPGALGTAQQETLLPLTTLANRLYTSTEGWTGPPTADQIRLTDAAHTRMEEVLGDLRHILGVLLPDLRDSMVEAGIPWPAGEIPVLPENLIPTFNPGSDS
jgi:hypothetical protein